MMTTIMDISLYPELQHFLNEDKKNLSRLEHWQWGLTFLLYIGRNKSHIPTNVLEVKPNVFYYGCF